MPILGVDQVSVAVEDLDDATRIYEGILGLKATHDETVEDQGVKTRFFPVARSGSVVEALLALGPDTPVGKFLAKRGPGVHHIAFRVDDLDAELARLKRQGVRLIDETPRKGAEGKRIAFLHPKETGGVLIELCESPHGSPAPTAAKPKQRDANMDGWSMHGSIGRTS
ncbi:MAG: methylmalonyl-CoA/ethylmalonyl-CoA epimerase [Thermoplasmata archaeon]|nr:methylmalonyl-CoA/ethylmalonyl-CoA epimerase [Thermoplasmata archaeon]